jgi:hypothetical protein
MRDALVINEERQISPPEISPSSSDSSDGNGARRGQT